MILGIIGLIAVTFLFVGVAFLFWYLLGLDPKQGFAIQPHQDAAPHKEDESWISPM